MDSARKALSEGRYEDMDWALLKGSRLHQRAMKTSVRRGLAELINLVRLFPSLELRIDDLPPEARALLDLPLAAPGDIHNLSETIGAVHGQVRRGIEARLTAVKEKVERSRADSSLSLSLLSVAARSLAEEKLEQAVGLARDAERVIGASMAEVQEMRALSRRYHELATIDAGLGLDARHHRDLFRQALRSHDVPAAVHRLKEAVSAAEKATAPYLPQLEIRSSQLFNHGSSPAMQIRLDDGEDRNGPVATPRHPSAGRCGQERAFDLELPRAVHPPAVHHRARAGHIKRGTASTAVQAMRGRKCWDYLSGTNLYP